MTRRYRWSTLTGAIQDKNSPLRQYLDTHFGNTAPLQRQFRNQSSELLVPGGSADPATIGSAFDLQLRFVLDHRDVPAIALRAFGGHRYEYAVVAALVQAAREAAEQGVRSELARACWALALCVAVYRGGLRPDSPLYPLIDTNRFSTTTLLGLAPPDAIDQLDALLDLAEQRLIPKLSRPISLGPEFDGSARCAADADLIADGLLLEIKTRLGKVTPTGPRTDRLTVIDIYQLLGYALFDTSDSYEISAIGVYSARYGSLVSWPLPDVLQELADRPIDVATARRDVWAMLTKTA